MKRLTMIGVALVAVFAMGAIFSASASATSAPFWSINGTRLAEGKTHFITAKAVSSSLSLSVAANGVVITCKKFKLKEGSLLGSSETNPGTNDEVVVFEECKLEAGNGGPTECKLEPTTLTTNSLKSELVERVAAPKILLTEFFPAKGAFITLKFTGSKCTSTSTAVEGAVAAEVKTPAGGTLELGQTAIQATSWNLNFPTTPIKKIILVKAGTAEEKEIELLAFSDPSVESGEALVALASGNGGPQEEVNWSPLP